jgi:hypothetical protein
VLLTVGRELNKDKWIWCGGKLEMNEDEDAGGMFEVCVMVEVKE